MLITKVKVGKITNLSEARYCAGMGVDFLSFPISSVDPKTYQEITGWVAGPTFGIEAEENSEILGQYNANFIQVSSKHIDLYTDKKLIVTLAVSDWSTDKSKLLAAKSRILFLELDTPLLDSQIKSVIEEIAKEFEVLIRLSNPTDLDQILQQPVAGISLEGSAEARVGLKEYPLAEVLEKLEES